VAVIGMPFGETFLLEMLACNPDAVRKSAEVAFEHVFEVF
jgi:hypothetical protein